MKKEYIGPLMAEVSMWLAFTIFILVLVAGVVVIARLIWWLL